MESSSFTMYGHGDGILLIPADNTMAGGGWGGKRWENKEFPRRRMFFPWKEKSGGSVE